MKIYIKIIIKTAHELMKIYAKIYIKARDILM